MPAAEAGQDAGPALTGGAALHIYLHHYIYLSTPRQGSSCAATGTAGQRRPAAPCLMEAGILMESPDVQLGFYK